MQLLPSSKSYTSVGILFFVFFCSALPMKGAAQKRNASKITVIPFGITDTGKFSHITYHQVIADPVLRCKDPNCMVSRFDVSFLPKGKEFSGPYHCSGAKIDDVVLEKIKALEKSGDLVRMFIDIKQMTCDKQQVNTDVGVSAVLYAQ